MNYCLPFLEIGNRFVWIDAKTFSSFVVQYRIPVEKTLYIEKRQENRNLLDFLTLVHMVTYVVRKAEFAFPTETFFIRSLHFLILYLQILLELVR